MESGSEGDDNSSVIEERSLSGDEDNSDEESSESSDEDDEDLRFDDMLQRIKENNPDTTKFVGFGDDERIQNMTDEEWEQVGRDVSNNTHLTTVSLYDGALNDHKMSFLFSGLTRSSSITSITFDHNGFSVAGVRSMVPFLQNSNNLTKLNLSDSNIQSEGFNLVFRELRDSPMKELSCNNNGIESIEIDRSDIPKNLKSLDLEGNCINADGCRELVKLLQGEDSTLTTLWLRNNKIDDEGVAILVDALQKNTSLGKLDLRDNDDISTEGKIMLLKLVNDISSIKATLQSNHTLRTIYLKDTDDDIQTHINMATVINNSYESNPKSAGREKVIQTQLHSVKRAALADLQGVNRSLFSEISPLHQPEVLSLIGRRHGCGELFVALKATIIGLLSTVNMKQCIQQEKAYHEGKIAEHRAKIEVLDAKLMAMEEAAERAQADIVSQSIKGVEHDGAGDDDRWV